MSVVNCKSKQKVVVSDKLVNKTKLKIESSSELLIIKLKSTKCAQQNSALSNNVWAQRHPGENYLIFLVHKGKRLLLTLKRVYLQSHQLIDTLIVFLK